ncbi:MAG: 3-phosphoglycerate dehydrogenase [Lachnospiraceae bacterium]|nr:3-phosphoglycerate dehydrogenase [Lachnospiraceae bacterium]
MFTYHCLNPISAKGLDLFDSNYNKTDDIQEADAILVRSAKMHELELPENLKAVARAGAGVNNIPLDKCADAGVVVFNTPGANANAVKELVISGMLLASRDIIGGNTWCKENKDDSEIGKTMEKAKKNFAGTELAGKTLGIIGLGAIGVLVANAAVHLGMEVYGCDPFISVNAAWNLSRSVHHSSSYDEIFEKCDFITVHVPLLDSTRNLINQEAIDKMKDGVVILNYARDLLVDEEAVIAGIKAGKIRKYVSDFPNPTTAGQENVILTPHLGASTEEAEDNCAVMAVEEIRDFLENGNIKHSVNYPDCDNGICTAAGRIGVLHHNSKGVIAQFATILGDSDINIADMTNKSRGDYAYALVDLDTPISPCAIEKLNAIEEVIRVHVVK